MCNDAHLPTLSLLNLVLVLRNCANSCDTDLQCEGRFCEAIAFPTGARGCVVTEEM